MTHETRDVSLLIPNLWETTFLSLCPRKIPGNIPEGGIWNPSWTRGRTSRITSPRRIQGWSPPVKYELARSARFEVSYLQILHIELALYLLLLIARRILTLRASSPFFPGLTSKCWELAKWWHGDAWRCSIRISRRMGCLFASRR